jgi:hypothetical protein
MSDGTTFIDATSIIDATADTTAIIIIDSTSTDAENLSATVAYGLVNDFNGFMGPIGAKCDQLGGQMDRIKDQISGIGQNYTPGGVFNNGVANGLNEAYNSSKWAQAKDVVSKAQDIMNKCSFFKEMAPEMPKYDDPFKQIKSLGKAAAEKAEAAADAAIDKIKNSSGYQFLEAQIGKSIAAITNTGRAVYDKVEEAVEDVEAAISPVIEYGKSAISQTQTALSSATKELAKMDKLIDCLSSIGGPDFSPQLDEMMDQMNCYYDKLGVFDDPKLPNFGEFDVDNYINSIGSVHPEAAQNIKKSINMYSKAKNNAEGAIAKATDISKKSKSVTAPGASATSAAAKAEDISNKSKTVQVIPGIPGKTEDKTVEVPEPAPIEEPPPTEPPLPPIPKVPLSKYITSKKFTVDPGNVYYDFADPDYAQEGMFLSMCYSLIQGVSIEEPDTAPSIEMEFRIKRTIALNEGRFIGERDAYYYWFSIVSDISLYFQHADTKEYITGSSTQPIASSSPKSLEKVDADDSPILEDIVIQCIKNGIEYIGDFSASDFEGKL